MTHRLSDKHRAELSKHLQSEYNKKVAEFAAQNAESAAKDMQAELERLRRENRLLKEAGTAELVEENTNLREQLQSLLFRGKGDDPSPRDHYAEPDQKKDGGEVRAN